MHTSYPSPLYLSAWTRVLCVTPYDWGVLPLILITIVSFCGSHYCAELGGNAPVLIFNDAQLDAAVNGAAFGAFVAAGQTCVSGKRLIIQDSIYEEFVAKLVPTVTRYRRRYQRVTLQCSELLSWSCPMLQSTRYSQS